MFTARYGLDLFIYTIQVNLISEVPVRFRAVYVKFVAPGQVSVPVLSVSAIPPMLCTHLHLFAAGPAVFEGVNTYRLG